MAGPLTAPAELVALETLISRAGDAVEVSCAPGAAAGRTPSMPVYTVALGNRSPEYPAIGFFAGIHGLERIGSLVVLALLGNIIERLRWDDSLNEQLRNLRMVFMPVVNPGGMARGTRGNPRGVDLMRNSPVDAHEPVPPLVGGHRVSPGLPWFRGPPGAGLEPETAAVCATVDREMLSRPLCIALDCHSGFGMRDRLWFPFAHRRAPFPWLPHIGALVETFEASHLHHPYVVEPQSAQYLAHGDIWDHLVIEGGTRSILLPLTLEMGSWLWIKKNPRQFFSASGLFNPTVEHRERRVLRRHFPLLEFLVRAAASHARWTPRSHEDTESHRARALARWYSGAGR